MEILNAQIPRLFQQFEQKADGRALCRAVQLLSSVEPDNAAPKAEAMSLLALKLRHLFTTINYIDAKLIPGFDFSKMPMLNVAPPFGSEYPAGVAPESIREPEIRAEYERALAENDARNAQYSLQSDLREADKKCLEIFQRDIAMHAQRYSNVALGALIEETIRSKPRAASLKALAATSMGQQR